MSSKVSTSNTVPNYFAGRYVDKNGNKIRLLSGSRLPYFIIEFSRHGALKGLPSSICDQLYGFGVSLHSQKLSGYTIQSRKDVDDLIKRVYKFSDWNAQKTIDYVGHFIRALIVGYYSNNPSFRCIYNSILYHTKITKKNIAERECFFLCCR